jgi:diaminohydroxyphosphoribosylaminopyrimidine deaminase/5-amino-6-(5-phosphoribosylamino)uracil reductase
MTARDIKYLSRALRIAEKGKYSTHPNPRVGCVLVRQGDTVGMSDRIVGEGYHIIAGSGHAEANALLAAGDQAKGATAYITLEPCSFHGRTPSCAQSLVSAGISRAVIAMLDPDTRNAGKGIRILEDAGIEVTLPMLETSAASLNPGHIKRYTKGLPFVRLKLAMSLDGKTALANGESKWITSAAARMDVQRLRAMSSAIVTGVQTVIDDNPSLTVRSDELDVPHHAQAISVARPVYILDSNGRTPPDANLAQTRGTVVVTTRRIPTTDIEPLDIETLDIETLSVPADGNGRVDLEAFLKELSAREHNEVLFECGQTLAGSLIVSGLVDEIILYIAPKFMGDSARSLLKLAEIDRMSDLVSLTITDVRKIGDDMRVTVTLNSS